MGGLRMVPDMILDDLDPADSNLLILPGADMWDAGEGQRSPRPPRVTWTQGSRGGHLRCHGWLVRAGLLDNRRHTSAAAGYLMATGYAGGDHYVNQRAVVDGDLITAGPQSPVQFPTLQRCGAGAWQRIPSSRRTREL